MSKSKVKDPRRVNDYWTRKAKSEKYPARSVYKLEEIDKKHNLFKSGHKVVDLGCSPGSWTIYASGRVGADGYVIGIDIQESTGNFSENTRILQADIFETPPDQFVDQGPFDVIMSDMAPKTTGNKNVDQARSEELCRAAYNWSLVLLKDGGDFLFKIFQGPDADVFINGLKNRFKSIKRIKPKSSRTISPEIFVLCTGFKR